MKSSAYAGYSMATPLSDARNNKIVEFMQTARRASTAEIAAGTGIDKRAADRHVFYLCETNNLELLTPKGIEKGAAAIYGYVEGEYIGPSDRFDQRQVAANAWPRGQHAYRSGLLAVMYPFAAQGA